MASVPQPQAGPSLSFAARSPPPLLSAPFHEDGPQDNAPHPPPPTFKSGLVILVPQSLLSYPPAQAFPPEATCFQVTSLDVHVPPGQPTLQARQGQHIPNQIDKGLLPFQADGSPGTASSLVVSASSRPSTASQGHNPRFQILTPSFPSAPRTLPAPAVL